MKKFILQIISIVIISIGLVLVVRAWTPPDGGPPTSNVSAPINTGNIGQSKKGDFGLGGEAGQSLYWLKNAGGTLKFDSTAPTINTRIVIGQDGNIGIGTASPGAKLHLIQPNDATGFRVDAPNIAANVAFSLEGMPLSTSINNGKAFQFKVSGEVYARGMFYSDGKYGIGPGNATRDIVLSRDIANQFKISSDGVSGPGNLVVTGSVGIGTTNPSATLEVAGQVKITGGSPGAGKVLTSDPNGLAAWEPAGGSLSFPNGTNGTIINRIISDTANYTVSANKTLFIFNAFSSSLSRKLQINGSKYFTVSQNTNFLSPLVVSAGNIISADGVDIRISGIEVDNSLAITIKNLQINTAGYTVPAGKTLFILSAYNDSLFSGNYLNIGGEPYLGQIGSNAGKSLSSPLVAPAGSLITANNDSYRITGYEK